MSDISIPVAAANTSLQRVRELELLDHIARDVTSTLDLERVLMLILDQVKVALGAEAASALLIEPKTNALVFRAASSPQAEGLINRRIPPGLGIAGWVAQHGVALIIADAAKDPRFYGEIDRIEGFTTRSILAVPLKVQDRLLGVLEAINKIDGTFTTEDERLLTLVVGWASVAIENALLYSEATQRAKELAIRNEVSQIVSAASDLQGLLDAVTTRLADIAGATTCLVLLGDPNTGPKPTTCYLGGQLVTTTDPHLVRVVELLGRELGATQPKVLTDLVASGYVSDAEAERCPVRAMMILPLSIGDAMQGLVLFGSALPNHFDHDDVARVMPLVQQVALAVRKVQMTEHLTDMVEARTSQLRNEQTRLNMIHEVDQVTVSSLDPIKLLRAAARRIRDAFGYHRVRIWMGSPGALTLAADAGGGQTDPTHSLTISEDTLPGWVASNLCSLYLWDVTDSSAPRLPLNDGIVGSALGLPLVAQQDLVGVLEIHCNQPSGIGEDDMSALETIVGRLAMALKNARLFAQVVRSQREWATTFDSIAEGVVVHDDKLEVVRVNRALAALLESAPDDLIGRDVVEMLCGAEAAEGAALRENPSAPLNIEISEVRHGRNLSITGYAIMRPDGAAGGRVLVVRDVTTERLWRARMLQTEKLASLGQLSAGIAHEINNPLGFIHSNLTTLARYAANLRGVITAYRDAFAGDARLAACEAGRDIDFLLQDVESAVSESQEGVERVQSIVTGLKSFARAEQGPETKAVDLNQVLEGALKIAWNEIKYKATVEKDYGALPEVNCNQFRIGQVFINLLVNAAQAIDDGEGRITLRTRSADDWVEISIQDTGHGVAPENLPRLFDPFFTTKEIGEGTGLGLSVVYGIVHEHGGQIDVASRAGQGTTFTIYLPVGGPATPAPAQSEAYAYER